MNDCCPHCGDVIPNWTSICPACGSETVRRFQPATIAHEAPLQPGYLVRLESAPPCRRVNFIVIQEHGPVATLECPQCGWQFRVNAYTGENITFDSQAKSLRETCPLCGTLQE